MATKEQAKESQKEKRSRREKRQQQQENKPKEKKRVFPIWQRIVVLILLSIIALIAGAIFGYGVLGDGSPIDALKIDTWKHIFDFLNKE